MKRFIGEAFGNQHTVEMLSELKPLFGCDVDLWRDAPTVSTTFNLFDPATRSTSHSLSQDQAE